jgi:hypothetical protein
MPGDSWIDELRADRIDQAIDHLRQELRTTRLFPSNYYSLGAAYMWSGDYQSAFAHFDEQIRARLPNNPAGDAAFSMAGVAAWCLGDEKLAVKYWRRGTTPGYAVAGANTRTALLLYTASVLKPDTFSAETADKLLREKAGHWRVKNWPGPIAQYILGTASEEEVGQEAAYHSDDPTDQNPKSWQFDFYKLLKNSASAINGMLALDNGIQRLLDVKGSGYLAGEKFFDFLRLEEFYLTRHWQSKRRSQQLA